MSNCCEPSTIFLKLSEGSQEGQIWKSLTEEQKKEVYLSFQESEEDKNLVSWDDVLKKTK